MVQGKGVQGRWVQMNGAEGGRSKCERSTGGVLVFTGQNVEKKLTFQDGNRPQRAKMRRVRV